MAATVVPNLTTLTTADATTNFDFGSWYAGTAGGTLDTEIYIQGGGTPASVAEGIRKNNTNWFEYRPAASFDMSATDTHLYWWMRTTIINQLETVAANGLVLRIASGSTDYKDWTIGGSDMTGWDGGWKCFVQDPTATADNTSGTLNLAAVTSIGILLDTTSASFRSVDNIWIDAIRYGTGLTVYGSTSFDFADIAVEDESLANKYGIIQNVDGVLFCQGRITIGDDSGTNVCNFDSQDEVLVFADRPVTSALYQVNFVGNGTGSTDIDLGIKVGTGDTASGRNGTLIMGANSNVSVSMDLDDGNVNNCKIYGSTFRLISGSISMGTNSAHEFIGNTVDQCGQFSPVGAPEIRTCIFSGTTDVDAAFLWNASIDIQSCKFIANTTGAAIEHTSGATATYTSLLFSGNTKDVYNNTGGAMSITKAGTPPSDPSTSEGSSVSFIGSVDITINTEDKDSNDVDNAQVYIQKSPATVYTSSTGNTAGGSTFTITETPDTDVPASGWMRVWNKANNWLTSFRYASWSGSIFTLKSEITYNCTGGGTSTSLQDTVNDFTALDIEEGDAIRNTTDGSWAIVDEIVDADNITTTPLKGGAGDKTWTSGDTYSIHRLPFAFTSADDLVDIPLLMGQTVSGQVTGTFTGTTPQSILVRIRYNNDATNKFQNYDTSGSISSTGYALTAVLDKDDVAT